MISDFVAIIVKLNGTVMQWVLALAVLPEYQRQGADSQLFMS